MTVSTADLLPVRTGMRGRPPAHIAEENRRRQRAFATFLKEIASTLNFKVGARGWCYILEEHGFEKGQFDAIQDHITECRKNGLLPIDFTAEDDNRAWDNLEQPDREDPREFAQAWVNAAAECADRYQPGSFWDFQDTFVALAVEKIDLKNLFLPVCEEYRVPICNAKGWSDLNSRAQAMLRFKAHEDAGRRVVLLYCGDFDPVGLKISDTLKKNFRDLMNADGVDWNPENLIVERFGLNRDFVEEQGLTWTDNLETSSGKSLADPRHEWHKMEFVQTWLREIGERKVEANTLVVRPDAGRQLCRDAIEKYLDLEAITDYQAWLAEQRLAVRSALPKVMHRKLREL
jgi:hypothetical protein